DLREDVPAASSAPPLLRSSAPPLLRSSAPPLLRSSAPAAVIRARVARSAPPVRQTPTVISYLAMRNGDSSDSPLPRRVASWSTRRNARVRPPGDPAIRKVG